MKGAHNGPEMGPKGAKTKPKDPEMASGAPRWRQDGAKMAPRWPQNGPRMAPSAGNVQKLVEKTTNIEKYSLAEARCYF